MADCGACQTSEAVIVTPSNAATRRALGRIQRLCCSGLGGQILMSPLMNALAEVIPASNRIGFLVGPQQELTGSYVDGPAAHLLPVYLSEYHNLKEVDFIRTLTDTMRATYDRAADDWSARTLRVHRRAYLRSEYYNAVQRPAEIDHAINLKVMDGPRPRGSINLCRTAHETPFSSGDYAFLERVAGFVGHALHERVGDERFVDTDDRAVAIIDLKGRLQHRSPHARRLLWMALVPQWVPTTAARLSNERSPELLHLARLLMAACAHGGSSTPPVLRRRNAWGEFELRAYWLDARYPEEPSRLVCITIERREPFTLQLWRAVESLDLSGREKQLCMLLVQGLTTLDAARVMGVGESTVITHRRHLYAKVAVRNRGELIDLFHFA